MPSAVVVIPTYNERGNIERLIPALFAQDGDIEVVVVDDNSPDGTGQMLEEMQAADPRLHVIRRPGRQGLGPAYRAGFARALAIDAPYIVQMDADFSHPPEMLPRFLALMDNSDLVLGSRYLNGITVVNWPIERLLISYFGNWYARRVTGLPVRDVTGGYKCWRREALVAVDPSRVRSNGYAFQIESTYRAWCKGLRIAEVPIVFMDRTVGESKMTKRIGLEALWVVWRLRLARALGRI